MAVEIVKVTTKRQLRKFIKLNYKLYSGDPYAVPDLYFDLMNTLRKDRNPAFDFCEADYFLAYKDGELVGKVAAIINHRANERWGTKVVRFGWIDFIDDIEVSEALLNAVMEWGRKRGMTEIQGPLGFTDFDKEGMLTEGFDELSTMITIYNYPYYPEHMKQLGYEKAAGWLEMQFSAPNGVPEKAIRVAEMVMKRYNLHVIKEKRLRVLAKKYGRSIFLLLNEAYSDLFGFSELSEKQISQYIKFYLNFVNLDLVSLIADEEDRLVGVGISMPSLSRALQKSRGRLFPLGWFHLLKALYKKGGTEGVDLLLVGVAKDYMNKGLPAIMMAQLIPNYLKLGYKWGESSCELEDNTRVQSMWEPYDHRIHKRRVAFRKDID